MKNILHLFIGGNIGGIEVLIKDFTKKSKHNNIVVSLWGDGPLADEMQVNGIEFISINGSTYRILFMVKNLIAIVDQHNIDVLVIHHASPVSHVCAHIVKLLRHRLKIVAYAHGNAATMYRKEESKGRFLRKIVMKESLKHSDYVIAISKSVKDSLVREFQIKNENIIVLYNAIDINKFKTQIRHETEKCRLIYVGRLIKFKGVQVALEALSKISIDYEWEFLIVGEGSYRNELENIASKCGLNDRVRFMGARRDVPELLSTSDVFIHVSIGEEGFGISIAEAMASGNICIGTRIGGIPELIDDRENGFLVPPGDAEGLAELLEQIMNARNSWSKIKENAIKKAENFDVNMYARQLDELLATI